jgi:hypothetical protein
MENKNKSRIFYEEILEIIPCGVSLRTFLMKGPEKGEIKREEKRSEGTQRQEIVK